jgi:hypothetical protein
MSPLTIQCGATDDGTLTYDFDHSPALLPGVRGRDLAFAWQAAREAAQRARWGGERAFRFRGAYGGWTNLSLTDRDATCWAAAVDGNFGLQTVYGLSLCLRLLALVDLLARAPWASCMMALQAGGAELNPALLRLAAETPLTDEARFDETRFRSRLGVQ